MTCGGCSGAVEKVLGKLGGMYHTIKMVFKEINLNSSGIWEKIQIDDKREKETYLNIKSMIPLPTVELLLKFLF